MTESTDQLNIRIKFAKPPESLQSSGSEYRWGRILLALGALVLLVVLVVKMVMPAPSPGPSPGTIAEPIAEPIEPATPEAVAEPVKLPSSEDATESDSVAATDEVPVVPASPAGQADAAALPTTEPGIEVAPRPVTPMDNDAPPTAGTTEPQAPGQDSVQSAAASTTEPQASQEAASVPASAARTAVIIPGQTRLLSPAVQRFVLTNAVKANEPVGGPGDITPDRAGNGVIKVYAYSQVRRLGGEQLIYRWLRGTQVVANVKVGVGSGDWRSYSSKYISKDMRGSWRVELRTAKGELLAFTEFEY